MVKVSKLFIPIYFLLTIHGFVDLYDFPCPQFIFVKLKSLDLVFSLASDRDLSDP